MESLLSKSANAIRNTNSSKKRYLFSKIDWNQRLIGIKGARGTGKSTLLLQKLGELDLPAKKASYWSLDDLFFSKNSLAGTAEQFHKNGGKILFLDEVHKYLHWSQHIKNLYDQFPELQIVFTGSSIIDLTREEADLSRRALMYSLAGMSYREYLFFKYDLNYDILELDQIRSDDKKWQKQFPKEFKPLEYFPEYLRQGYYPFSLQDEGGFLNRLQQTIRIIVEYDMASLKEFDIRNAQKMLRLLYILSANVPFKPNISELSRKSNIHRNTITTYLNFLEQAQLIRQMLPSGISISALQRPEKLYLNNTNLAYALASNSTNKGNIRETFFASQLAVNHKVSLPKHGDFMIDDKWVFEIGGKAKSQKQIAHISNSFVVADDKDFPVTVLPLWVFGMLY